MQFIMDTINGSFHARAWPLFALNPLKTHTAIMLNRCCIPEAAPSTRVPISSVSSGISQPAIILTVVFDTPSTDTHYIDSKQDGHLGLLYPYSDTNTRSSQMQTGECLNRKERRRWPFVASGYNRTSERGTERLDGDGT